MRRRRRCRYFDDVTQKIHVRAHADEEGANLSHDGVAAEGEQVGEEDAPAGETERSSSMSIGGGIACRWGVTFLIHS